MKTICLNFTATHIRRLAWILMLVCAVAAVPLPSQAAILSTPAAAQGTASTTLLPQWVAFVASETSASVKYDELFVVNTRTNQVHGPFLRDQLTPIVSGNPDGKLDANHITIAPNGTALISSFSDKKVHFVNLSNPLAPVYLSFVQLTTEAGDIAITVDGRYGLVTGGVSSKIISSIDIPNRQLAAEFTLPQYKYPDPDGTLIDLDGYASSIAVGPDGTVLAVDLAHGSTHSLTIETDGSLKYTGSHTYLVSKTGGTETDPRYFENNYNEHRLNNVSISPDGKTALVSELGPYSDVNTQDLPYRYGVGVYKITAPGVIEFVEMINKLPRAMPIIRFTSAGDRAIMLGNSGQSCGSTTCTDGIVNYFNDGIYALDISGPGQVKLNSTLQVELKRYTNSRSLGMNGLVINGNKAYATYARDAITQTDPARTNRYLSIVNLSDFSLTEVDLGPANQIYPHGMAEIPLSKVNLPLIVR